MFAIAVWWKERRKKGPKIKTRAALPKIILVGGEFKPTNPSHPSPFD